MDGNLCKPLSKVGLWLSLGLILGVYYLSVNVLRHTLRWYFSSPHEVLKLGQNLITPICVKLTAA
jgi:hypothetical protein